MHRVSKKLCHRRYGRALGALGALGALAVFVATASCFLGTGTTLCEQSGLRCRPGQTCAANQPVCIDVGGCGDGVVGPGEVCDDGNIIDKDGCSADCRTMIDCGDGIVDPGEDCDAGAGDSPGCDADCTFVECGDGHVNRAAGEECDSAGAITAECNGPLCTLPRCGDSFYNPFFAPPATSGEECDTGGNTLTCDSDCTAPACGDGHLNPAYIIPGLNHNEVCDDGVLVMGVPTPTNSATCDADCTPAACGDGHHNPAALEQCDDGVLTMGIPTPRDSANCNFNCTLAVCGDGYHNPMAGEACDDGILIMGIPGPRDSASCDSDCTPAVCGDGHHNPMAMEECDDGNTATDDACPKGGPGGTCKLARCGDGYVRTGVEECDPADPVGNTCFPLFCGMAGTMNECKCI
jgi:cysteine-rich repeat protein